MKLTLLGWESTGLRCPDFAIDISKQGVAPRISLVQMPNGTGKTTTLDLIKASLTGRALDWSSDDVRRLRRPGSTNDSGKFVLKLLADNDPLTFELSFDFLEEKISYRTSCRATRGIKDGWEPPMEVKRFLNDRFVPLFIFNGELAQDLLDGRQAKALEAIDALCQLEHLDTIVATALEDWQHETRNQGAKTASGLAGWKSREERLEKRLKKVQDARQRFALELSSQEVRINELNTELNDRLKYDHTTQKRKEEIEARIRTHENSLIEKTSEILQLIRQPQFLSAHFAGGLAMLKDQFDRVRLPERTSRQFFVELADESQCVCGRPIGKQERQVILGQANNYLASELYSFINNLKGDISQSVLDEPTAIPSRIESAVTEQKVIRKELSHLRTELEQIRAESITDSGDVAQKLASELMACESERDELIEMLAKIDAHPDSDVSDDSWSIRGLERELTRVRNSIAQITGTVELKARLDAIKVIAERTKEIARERLREAIRDDCNKKLEKVLSGDPIRIDKIGNSLSLRGQDGASVGQTLAVGYTFLTTLLNRGAHKFPLVVDSPAGSLDDGVRTRVGRMIPALCEQFVAFTISTERGYFLPALEEVAGDSIVYLTAFRTTQGMQSTVDSLPANAIRSFDGAVVSDREYFMKFEMPQEQE